MSKAENFLSILIILTVLIIFFTKLPEREEKPQSGWTEMSAAPVETLTKYPGNEDINNPPELTDIPFIDVDATGMKFTQVDEIVYVNVKLVNVRLEPSMTTDSVVYVAYKGESFRRIWYNPEWSVILYDGQPLYVSSDYLSTEDPNVVRMNFIELNQTLTVMTNVVNIRDLPSYDAQIIGGATMRQRLKATGISEDGEWYRIDYVTSDGTVWEAYVDASCVK
ncbi:MAG: SH3 domain-containing protein [Clostridia bacterium]|nr:SH3 domain-containing protein [Clostridia bacterium]